MFAFCGCGVGTCPGCAEPAGDVHVRAGPILREHRRREPHMQSVARFVSDDVGEGERAEEREVAEKIEQLVPAWFVGEAQRACRAEGCGR